MTQNSPAAGSEETRLLLNFAANHEKILCFSAYRRAIGWLTGIFGKLISVNAASLVWLISVLFQMLKYLPPKTRR